MKLTSVCILCNINLCTLPLSEKAPAV